MSSQRESPVPTTQRHACDNCKARKTKCDRRIPCASCVTAGVQCQTTERPPQKRQRILLSSKYEDAMQDVSQQLHTMSGTLQALVERAERSNPGSSEAGPSKKPSHPYRQESHEPCEGYQGDSSFDAHAATLASAMQSRDSPYSDFSGTQILRGLPQHNPAGVSDHQSILSHADFEERPMPPSQQITRLLRLIQREKQRFFYDAPIIDEEEFTEMCKEVCFPTEPYLLSTWIMVNVGLYYLFTNLPSCHHAEVGITGLDVQEYTRVLASNADAAGQGLRLCLDPSIKTCSALILLGEYYCKRGRKTTAWSLICTAARMTLDLGLHRFDTGDPDDIQVHKHRMLFWWIYAYDHGLAFTLGRSPTIQHYDVATHRPDFGRLQPGMCGELYNAWIDFAVTAGEIHLHLFSASAYRYHEGKRNKHAQRLALELSNMQQVLAGRIEILQESHVLEKANSMLSMLVSFLLAMVYRTQGQTNASQQRQQHSVLAAERGLAALVAMGEGMIKSDRVSGWGRVLNCVLCFVPFTAFIIIVGEAIATLSHDKLALLRSVLSVLGAGTADSPSTERLYDICTRFYQFAETVLAEKSRSQSPEMTQKQAGVLLSPSQASVSSSMANESMTQAEWEEVMRSLDIEMGDPASSALTREYDPFTLDWGS